MQLTDRMEVLSRHSLSKISYYPSFPVHHLWWAYTVAVINVLFQSGLTEASKNSKISIEEAEQQILNFLQMHIPSGKIVPLKGWKSSNIWEQL